MGRSGREAEETGTYSRSVLYLSPIVLYRSFKLDKAVIKHVTALLPSVLAMR
jgi:hypothetical protein